MAEGTLAVAEKGPAAEENFMAAAIMDGVTTAITATAATVTITTTATIITTLTTLMPMAMTIGGGERRTAPLPVLP
jgi:hypothetical protein